MGIIVKSFNQINEEQLYHQTISESFNIYIVNPYAMDSDLEKFTLYLDKLSQVKAHNLLLNANSYTEFKGSLQYILNWFRFPRSKMLGFKKCANYKIRLQISGRKKVAASRGNQIFFCNNYEAYGSMNPSIERILSSWNI